MGPAYQGKVIAVAVDGRKNTEAAFRTALTQVGPEDRLLIIFTRPIKSGGFHYKAVTRSVQRRFDAMSAQILGKYSALAAEAKVSFEAVEVEGAHLREALLRECHLAAADVLYEAARTGWERLADPAGYNLCQLCNPYLRTGGRYSFQKPCHLAFSLVPPCPVIQVAAV